MTQPTLYLGTVGEGLWRSDDGGAHWQRRAVGMFVECDVRAIAADPRDSNVLYAGTNEGCYRTDDRGENWRPLDSPMDDLVVWSLLVLPDRPDTILAGTRPARLYRSDDGGGNWSKLDTPFAEECFNPLLRLNRVTTIRVDPEHTRRLWAGVEIDAVWVSDDDGETWEQRSSGLSSTDIHGLAIVPASNGRPRAIVAATNNDLNISTDEGRTWVPQRVGDRFEWPYCRGIAQQTDRPEVIFLGNGEGPPGFAGAIRRSSDAGNAWESPALPGRPNSTIWDFALHPSDPALVYAYTVSGQVYRTTDGGGSWDKLPREFGEIRALVWLPQAEPRE